MTPKQLIRALERQGWRVHRTRGSHQMMLSPDGRKVVPIPVHNRALKAGTLAGILRATDLARDQLRELL